MDNKKLGITIIAISLVFGTIIFSLINQLNQRNQVLGCNERQECAAVQSSLSWSHFGIGALFFAFGLGFFLIFFNKSEEAILQRLEEEKNKKLSEDKLSILLKAMDENEKRILRAIAEQNGITQNTLRLRVDLSKAKVSQILSSFEKKGIVKREVKGKTLAVYLTEFF